MIAAVMCLCAAPALAGDAPANSRLALEETFEGEKLGEGWHINKGQWKVADGVLTIAEIEADKHAAAGRRSLPTTNAVYELKFRLLRKARAFHLGFDPAKGELKKKGHLFSVVIARKNWKVLKHQDKNNPAEDPNQSLASQDTQFETGKWYTLRVTTWGKYVTAQIDGKESLKASHESFAVKKPGLVFRCIGDGVEIDELRVWTQNGK